MDAKKGRSLGRLPRGRGGAVGLRECHLDNLEVPPYECNTRCFSFCNTARPGVRGKDGPQPRERDSGYYIRRPPMALKRRRHRLLRAEISPGCHRPCLRKISYGRMGTVSNVWRARRKPLEQSFRYRRVCWLKKEAWLQELRRLWFTL